MTMGRQKPFGKAYKPRGRRGTSQNKPQPQIVIKGRNAKAVAAELAKQVEKQENKQAARNDLLAKSGAWRFRRHMIPFAWLIGLILTGAILGGVPHPFLWANVAALVVPAAIWKMTRHLSSFARRWTEFASAWASVWLFLLGLNGLRWCVPWLLLTWLPLVGAWVKKYRWRPAQPEPVREVPGLTGDLATWKKLTEEKRWNAELTDPEVIPGGRKWQIHADGIKTHIGHIMAEPRGVPAAWHKARTEAYVEPHSGGVESRGVLTLLNEGTLEGTVTWNGKGFGPDGVGRLGRFADGKPVLIRIFNPRNGTVHFLIAGTTGAGKSGCLDDLIWMDLNSAVPIVPVILDPQNGQSLPQWQGKVLYAAGMDECVRMVRALDVAMDDRSRRLASLTWDDDGHRVKGMNFFDPHLSGLPIVAPVWEEAPQLLTGDGNSKLGTEMAQKAGKAGKLGRKAGLSMALVAQVPSLMELGGNQAMRAMLAGGNVISLRTAEKVSATMLGLEADPSSLPKYFPDGSPTAGLGYTVAVDNRQAPMRIDRPDRDPRHEEWPMVLPDDGWMEAMNRVLDKKSPTATEAPPTQKRVVQPLRPAAVTEPAETEPEGRRCVDAVWLVLTRRTQTASPDIEKGELAGAVNALTREWGRDNFSLRAISGALRDLVDGKHEGREVIKPNGDKGGVYRAVITETTANDHAGKAA